ncbi:acetoacetate decarboxylase [Legionella jordanis]|uniref:Acetoacetate decarboxylase n=1 Tax=Legionella jordanis TaxID=456 RepID=A0A0W0VE90_9GAMM|nr:acetoacetate decarboxylase [Legionella jordanis]KTD18392.1 acetoacetate decarboxylase [Legionella jordanis]RMX05300.1 acetoacetate decarboxylase [Legionella jordanis]RMX20849.1 acetoacetate decarboxylase [Legionella jordanis]VEH13262.1 acetoacetate decarboxylase [Legionella jordanis]HAT8713612.1 acetoacetate decarboxylase [Legionella jordanis]
MKESQIREQAFAMPFCSPSYPRGPYRFINREYLIITYETDLDLLREVVPAPLEVTEPLVKFEVIRMPDSTGFGDYTESGQVIPVRYKGKEGGYTHAMYLDDQPPISGGREIWGFPKKLASPTLGVHKETLVGTLDYGNTRIATATMGYKYTSLDNHKIAEALGAPTYLLKIIPHVDGSVRICELVEYNLEDITIKGAWTGPAQLELCHHALAPVAKLPVKRVINGVHFVSDLTLPYGRVVHDYLK